MLSKRSAVRGLVVTGVLLLVASALIPLLSAERFRSGVEAELERVLQREVTIGELRFSVWPWPGFTIRDVVIADLPEISAEPFAYVNEVRAGWALASLWRGRLVFSSITLTQPSVNIAQGPASAATDGSSGNSAGAWNYEQILRSSVGAGTQSGGPLPEVVVREGRINFRSGLTKSIYYFRSADLRLVEEGQGTGAWLIEFRAEPARTDSFAPRFGTVRGRGRWRAAAGSNGQLDADVEIERSPLAEIASLFRASRVGLSGFLSARAHLSGPAEALAIRGHLELSERGDWGLFTQPGSSARIPVSGELNLPARRLHLEANPVAQPGAAPPPGSTSGQSADAPDSPEAAPPAKEGNPVAPAPNAGLYEAALDLNPEFAEGEWVAGVRFEAMPVAHWIGLLRYLDASFPDYPQLDGALSGEVSYRSASGLRGTATGDFLSWQPRQQPPFALRSIALRLEGELVEGSGLLDLEPPAKEPPAPDVPVSAPPTDPARQLPGFGFTLDRQAGRVQLSLQGKRLSAASFAALNEFAPFDQSTPWMLDDSRWQASGTAVWQKASHRDPGAWHGQLLVRGLALPVPGLTQPVVFDSLPLQLQGESWKMSAASARVGQVRVNVDAVFEKLLPGAAPSARRPLSLSLAFDQLSLAQVQAATVFDKSDSRGFLSRTFSLEKRSTPPWLRNRSLRAKVYIEKVLIGDSKYHGVRGDFYWDGGILEGRNISLQSRFGLLRAAFLGDLSPESPNWTWKVQGQTLPWNGAEVDIMLDGSASGALAGLPARSRTQTEISLREWEREQWRGPATVRLRAGSSPGAKEPTICAHCVEVRTGAGIWLGGCEPGNGTTRRCLLEDPRTGQKHEINLPISLFGLGAN